MAALFLDAPCLPETLRSALSACHAGRPDILRAARAALEAAAPSRGSEADRAFLADLGGVLLVEAFEADPLAALAGAARRCLPQPLGPTVVSPPSRPARSAEAAALDGGPGGDSGFPEGLFDDLDRPRPFVPGDSGPAREEAWRNLPAAARRAAAPVLDAWRLLARGFVPPGEDRYRRRLEERGEADKLVAYLGDKAAREPGNWHWRAACLPLALGAGDFETAGALFPEKDGPLAPLAQRFQGDVAFLAGDFQTAARRYQAALAGAEGAWPGTMARLAEARLRLGDRAGAENPLADLFKARPWRLGDLLRLFDLARGLDLARARLPGDLAVLLQVRDRAEALDAALGALADSDAFDGAVDGRTRAYVVDNGSSDATGQALDGWLGRLGAGRLVVERLPVFVGGPAALNWLLRLAGEAGPAWLAVCDEPVRVPGDWAGRLAAAVAAYPEAGVWGCRWAVAPGPGALERADRHLFAPEREPAGPGRPFGRKFSLSGDVPDEAADLAGTLARAPDVIGRGFLRPCATAPGGLRLYAAKRLARLGEMDLRFSLSEARDLDLDLRGLASGRPAVCQGHLRLPAPADRAVAATGADRGVLEAADAFKLHGKHGLDEAARAMDLAVRATLDDVREKGKALHDRLASRD